MNSDAPSDKLRAVLNHDGSELGRTFPQEYLNDCANWFSDLSEHDWWIVNLTLLTYESGDQAEAEKMAAALPAAPKCPP